MSGLVLAAPATTAAAAVQSSTGFGFALLLGPALFAVLPAGQALTLLLVLGLELNMLVLFGERRRRIIAWSGLRPVLVAALPGLVVGALAARWLPKAALQCALGLAVLAAAAVQLSALREERRKAALHAPAGAGWAVGTATGILTTATSISGPLLVLWLHAQGVRGARLRDTLSAAFLLLNLAGAAVLWAALGVHRSSGHIGWLLALVPLVGLGHLAGRLAFERLTARRHEVLVLACVAFAGCGSLVAGVLAVT